MMEGNKSEFESLTKILKEGSILDLINLGAEQTNMSVQSFSELIRLYAANPKMNEKDLLTLYTLLKNK